MLKPKQFISSHAAGSLLALCVLIGLSGLAFETREQRENTGGGLRGALAGVQQVLAAGGNFFRGTVNAIDELANLREEYQELQKTLREYEISSRDNETLEAENKRLREQLGFKRELTYRHVAARIVAMDPGDLFHGMTINKGMADGVAENMPVIAYLNGKQGLVGKVISAGEHNAMILPLFDQECYVAARLQSSRTEGLVEGNGNKTGSLYMRYIAKRSIDKLRHGDLVVSSGYRSIYPAAIPIGTVKKIEAPEWQASLLVELEPIIDFSRLEYVYILQQEGEE